MTALGDSSFLHIFDAKTDGCRATFGVVEDRDGNLFGTSNGCGKNLLGTLFEIPGGATEHPSDPVIRHYFDHEAASEGGGVNAIGSLFIDENNVMYGVTQSGGSAEGKTGGGVVYRYAFDEGGQPLFDTLYRFRGTYDKQTKDGASPLGGVTVTNDYLIGTTESAGENNWGTVYGIDLKNLSWNRQVRPAH